MQLVRLPRPRCLRLPGRDPRPARQRLDPVLRHDRLALLRQHRNRHLTALAQLPSRHGLLRGHQSRGPGRSGPHRRVRREPHRPVRRRRDRLRQRLRRRGLPGPSRRRLHRGDRCPGEPEVPARAVEQQRGRDGDAPQRRRQHRHRFRCRRGGHRRRRRPGSRHPGAVAAGRQDGLGGLHHHQRQHQPPAGPVHGRRAARSDVRQRRGAPGRPGRRRPRRRCGAARQQPARGRRILQRPARPGAADRRGRPGPAVRDERAGPDPIPPRPLRPGPARSGADRDGGRAGRLRSGHGRPIRGQRDARPDVLRRRHRDDHGLRVSGGHGSRRPAGRQGGGLSRPRDTRRRCHPVHHDRRPGHGVRARRGRQRARDRVRGDPGRQRRRRRRRHVLRGLALGTPGSGVQLSLQLTRGAALRHGPDRPVIRQRRVRRASFAAAGCRDCAPVRRQAGPRRVQRGVRRRRRVPHGRPAERRRDTGPGLRHHRRRRQRVPARACPAPPLA